MSLIFKKDKQNSGKLCKGYLGNWDYSRNKGSYSKGKDFLSLHWEIKDDSKNKVRFHVESPVFSINNELNLIKNKLIIAILAKILEIKSFVNVGEVEIGSMLLKSDTNKCTEVFKVVLFQNNTFSTYEENIEQVNNQVEVILNEILSKFSSEIKQKGLVHT